MPYTVETAPPEILVETFADLLCDRLVFTPDYGPDLDELIDNLPNDSVNAIASSIKTWCKARPEIWAALDNKLGKHKPMQIRSNNPLVKFSPYFALGLVENFSGAVLAKAVPLPQPDDYITLLKNRRRENFPEPVQQQICWRKSQQPTFPIPYSLCPFT